MTALSTSSIWQKPLAILPYAYIGIAMMLATYYAFPQTDDFCTFGRLLLHSKGNPLLETWYLYQNWTGRYSSSLVVALVGWLSSISTASAHVVYGLSLAALIALYAWGCVAITRTASLSRRANVILAAIIFAASLTLMPSKLEELFWLTGSAVYFAGISVLLITLTALASRADDSAPAYRFDWPVLCLIALSVGFNEFIAIALGGYLLLSLLVDLKNGRGIRRNAKYLAVFALAFAATVLAPGNFARDAGISTDRHSIQAATSLAAASFRIFSEAMLKPNLLLFFSLLLASAGAGLVVRREPSERSSRFLIVPFVLVASFPMHLWVYSFLTGEQTPGRIINQAFALLFVGACLGVAWLAQRMMASSRLAGSPIPLLVVAIGGILLVSSVQFQHFAKASRDFAPVWRHQQLQRHHLLVDSAPTADVSVPRLPSGDSNPPVFNGADISDDPANWINRCVADYYMVRSVKPAK